MSAEVEVWVRTRLADEADAMQVVSGAVGGIVAQMAASFTLCADRVRPLGPNDLVPEGASAHGPGAGVAVRVIGDDLALDELHAVLTEALPMHPLLCGWQFA